MLAIVRLLLAAALVFGLVQAARAPAAAGGNPDLTGVFWIAYCVVLAILTAIAWVPWLGDQVADPATGPITKGAFVEPTNRLLALIRSLERRGWRRFTRWLAFIEGVRHPWLPGAFVAGLNTARAGSWLERAYAREVLRFNNADNCIRAYQILRQHGETPPPHRNDKINAILASLDRAAAIRSPLAVPHVPPPPYRLDPRSREPRPPIESPPATEPGGPGATPP